MLPAGKGPSLHASGCGAPLFPQTLQPPLPAPLTGTGKNGHARGQPRLQ